MKNLILLLILFGALNACSKGSETPVEVDVVNKAPATPTLAFPEDNLFCTVNELDFQWSSSIDPEGDVVSYVFELATLGDFSDMYFEIESSTLAVSKEVSKGQNFYWRVRAKDDKNNFSSYSPIRSFYTEAGQSSNSLPSVPQLISPDNNSIVSDLEVELNWEANDEDEEQLRYELYFGTTETPALLVENLLENTYFIRNLNNGKTYYWQIKAIDERNGTTIGQVWSFTTN
jgi:hypothetical protein